MGKGQAVWHRKQAARELWAELKGWGRGRGTRGSGGGTGGSGCVRRRGKSINCAQVARHYAIIDVTPPILVQWPQKKKSHEIQSRN